MLKNATRFIKNYKFVSFALLAIIIAVVAQLILMIFSEANQVVGNFYIETTTPTTGARQIFDTFEKISFTFSQPVELESVTLTISPPIEYRTTISPNGPNTLNIIPLETGWRPGTRYNVVINEATSIDGEKLSQPFQFTYQNIPPSLKENDIAY